MTLHVGDFVQWETAHRGRQQGKVLYISNITKADEGFYSCDLYHDDVVSSLETIFLNVLCKHWFSFLAQTVRLAQFVIQCRVQKLTLVLACWMAVVTTTTDRVVFLCSLIHIRVSSTNIGHTLSTKTEHTGVT